MMVHIGFILLLHLAQTGLTLLLLYSHMTVKSSGFVSLFPSSSSPQGVSLADFEDVVKSAATCLQSDFDVKRFALRLKSFKTFLSSVFHRGTDCSALVSVSLDLCVCVCVWGVPGIPESDADANKQLHMQNLTQLRVKHQASSPWCTVTVARALKKICYLDLSAGAKVQQRDENRQINKQHFRFPQRHCYC